MTTDSSSNDDVYDDPDVVARYAGLSHLHDAERRLLDDLLPRWSQGRILDIGVGGGRTTANLADAVAVYVGIEPSPGLLAAARQTHPGVRLELGDARDLTRFEDNSFDAVFFSFNGLDYVDDAGRAQALDEIRRVLVPGGDFLFSTHNRDHDRFGLLPWQGQPIWNKRTLRASLGALYATPARRRLRGQERHEAAFAIVNDDAHRYSLLTYYISPDAQVAQLAHHGFTDVTTYDQWGVPAASSGPSVWMYYLAR